MTKFNKAALTSVITFVLIIGIVIVSFAKSTGTVVKEAKLRKTESDDSIILEIIPKKEEVEILEVHDDWYKVNYMKIKGYVRKEFIELDEVEDAKTNTVQENEQVTNEEEKIEEEQKLQKGSKAVVKDNTVVRIRPLINSITKADIEKNKKVEIITIMKNWAFVDIGSINGWIELDYLQTEQEAKKQELEAKKLEEEQKKKTSSRSSSSRTRSNKTYSTNATGQEIANYAKQFVGSKYVYGGANPNGFDCSGLTMYVYSKYGISLPHSATSQSKLGVEVNKSELKVGDLVFFTDFKTGKGIGHVGIYIGGNQFVHASTEKTGVIISSLTSGSYVKRYVTAVRLVNN